MKGIFSLLAMLCLLPAMGQFQSDVLKTSGGELEMFFIGHGTLMFEYNELIIHIDPTTREADYSKLPDADLVLVTHQHGDHLDLNAINQIVKEGTQVVMTQRCLEQLEDFDAIVQAHPEITLRSDNPTTVFPRSPASILDEEPADRRRGPAPADHSDKCNHG